MTHEEKIKYMAITANVCGFGITVSQADLLVCLYDLVVEKEGETDLKSISKIEAEVQERVTVKNRSALLDNISEKV